MIGLWFLKTVYALCVHVQFTVWAILLTAGIIAVMFALMATPLLRSLEWSTFALGRRWYIYALACTALLAAFAYSPSREFSAYVSTFPLLQTESGLGWHQDTAFHVSLIQRILIMGGQVLVSMDYPLNFTMCSVIMWMPP